MPQLSTNTPDGSLGLDSIVPLLVPDQQPDPQTAQEIQDLDLQRKAAEIDGLKQDITERKNYASKIFRLVVGWLIGIGGLLVLCGALQPWGLFQLPEGVLLAAIGSTTVNVLGLFIIVANYLFPKRGS